MSTRKNTKFNKNNGYKDFSFSITKNNSEVSNKITYSPEDNYPENMLNSKSNIPHKD